MTKPITIVKDGRKWLVTWTQNGKPCAFVAKDKEEARSVAHRIGRYRLGLGDFVYSYTEGY